MTDQSRASSSREALDELHRLMSADPLDVDDDQRAGAELRTADGQVDESDVDATLTAVGMDVFSADAQALLFRLTDHSENLEPRARHMISDAAARGLRHRRESSGTLPVLLFGRRRDSAVPLAELAAQIAISASELVALERGDKPIREATPTLVASWVSTLNVDTETAVNCLRRTLVEPSMTLSIAGVNLVPLTEVDQNYLDEVGRLLRERSTQT